MQTVVETTNLKSLVLGGGIDGWLGVKKVLGIACCIKQK